MKTPAGGSSTHRSSRPSTPHSPGAKFSANYAWFACAAIAHNLTRAAGHLAAGAYRSAWPATIRTRIITVAARLAHRAIHLHPAEQWPWKTVCDNPFTPVATTPG